MADWLSGFPAIISAVNSPIGLVALGLLLVASLAVAMTSGLDTQWRAGVFLAILFCFVGVLLVMRPIGPTSAAIAETAPRTGSGGSSPPPGSGAAVAATSAGSGASPATSVPAGAFDPTLPGPDGYILPQSGMNPIDPASLDRFSAQKLRLARNEIYARHGMVFTTPETKAYFAGKSWYSPTTPGSVPLSLVEQQNVLLIRRVEASRG